MRPHPKSSSPPEPQTQSQRGRSEFERIDRFTRRFQTRHRSVVAGPGDDCALTRPTPGRLLVTKVDQIVEGVHFGSAFRPREIGHKALAVALSDLAAAGATPRWFLVALALPESVDDRFLDEMARGMAALADRFEVSLIGGNFTSAAQLSLSVTAIGEAEPTQALRREGARPGDLLVLSGELGLAAWGLRQLEGGRPRRPSAAARAQLTPEPRTALGKVAGRYANAGIDVSDGFLQDLGHLCRRSGVGAELSFDALPIPAELRRRGEEGLAWALGGGEDYELLFAVPKERLANFRRAAARIGEKLSVVGTLRERPGIRLLDGEGRPMGLPALRGWEHFSRSPSGKES